MFQIFCAAAVLALTVAGGCCRGESASKQELSEPLEERKGMVAIDGTLSPEGNWIIKTGKKCTIELESNPSTGYAWELETLSVDSPIRLADEKFVASDKNMPGAPGKQIFTFEAAKPGKAQVKLNYRRSWEKNVPPENSLHFDFEVKE